MFVLLPALRFLDIASECLNLHVFGLLLQGSTLMCFCSLLSRYSISSCRLIVFESGVFLLFFVSPLFIFPLLVASFWVLLVLFLPSCLNLLFYVFLFAFFPLSARSCCLILFCFTLVFCAILPCFSGGGCLPQGIFYLGVVSVFVSAFSYVCIFSCHRSTLFQSPSFCLALPMPCFLCCLV